MKGLRKISTFVTADALLAAILLVWAQMWAQPSLQFWLREYGKCNPDSMLSWFNFNAGLGLCWTYLAVFLALLALIWAGWKTLVTHDGDTPNFAIGLFAASIVMAALDVGQSFVIVGVKLIQGLPIYEPFELSSCLLWISPLLAALIILLSLLGACALNKKKCRYLPWKIELIIILISGAIGAYLLKDNLGCCCSWTLVGVMSLLALVLISWFSVKRWND
jgi:hypothetical protein